MIVKSKQEDISCTIGPRQSSKRWWSQLLSAETVSGVDKLGAAQQFPSFINGHLTTFPLATILENSPSGQMIGDASLFFEIIDIIPN